MKLIISLLNGAAVAIGIFVLLSVLLANSPQLGLLGSLLFVLAALIALVWPFRPAWLGSRFVSTAILCIAALGAIASIRVATFQRHELAAANEVRLQELRNDDPKAYLAELKAANDARWESELQALDKQGYEKLLTERRLKEDAARKVVIEELLDEIKTVSPSNVSKLYTLYARLNDLDPAKEEYKRKRELFSKQMNYLANPETYVGIEDFSWTKQGFGNIMEANFTIKNSLPWAVKDIEIRCEHDAPSGTTIDSTTRTIYERFEANKSRRIAKFSMGFIHSQANRSGCRIVRVVLLR